jgi:hypothetical protein
MTRAAARRPERITVGIDGSLCSHAAVRWAIDHAQAGDTVTLVHAWRASSSMSSAGLVDPTDDSAASNFANHGLARAQASHDAVTICCSRHGDTHTSPTNPWTSWSSNRGQWSHHRAPRFGEAHLARHWSPSSSYCPVRSAEPLDPR